MIRIREFKKGDEFELWKLKVDTIRKINISDYSNEQINAWASGEYDSEKWSKRVQDMNPYVAEIDGRIVGFADIQKDGYIDHFFCHCKFQGQGVGKTLIEYLLVKGKKRSIPRLYSHVSITAKPFFERFGFTIVKQHSMDTGGQSLTNYIMERSIS